jgi:hypothetical protein
LNPNLLKHTDDVGADSPRSWRGLYALVLGELIVLIVLFYVFTKVFE